MTMSSEKFDSRSYRLALLNIARIVANSAIAVATVVFLISLIAFILNPSSNVVKVLGAWLIVCLVAETIRRVVRMISRQIAQEK